MTQQNMVMILFVWQPISWITLQNILTCTHKLAEASLVYQTEPK